MLRVDGKDRSCPVKIFEFLRLLLSVKGSLISRSDILEALWPGGQVISDEALTQVIFRARAAIEPYGKHIQTLRGKGLRLEGKVHWEAVPAGSSKTDSTPSIDADTVVESIANPHRHDGDQEPLSVPAEPVGFKWKKLVIASTALLLLILAGFWFFRQAPEPGSRLVDGGYGLYEQDLLAESPETVTIISEALKNEAVGERERARLLLQAVHEKDRTTPIPALLMSVWAMGDGVADQSESWLTQADERLGTAPNIYLKLLRNYVAAEESGSPQQIINNAGALLDIRPGAWRLRLARAHLMEYSGMREAALREIQQIDVPAYGDRKLEMVIADRASFGDLPGAQEMVDRLGPAESPGVHAFLNGRIAWSRGDLEAALVWFDSAIDLAYTTGRLDIYRRALIYAGALEIVLEQDEAAIARLEKARSAAVNHSMVDEIDITLMLAQLHAEAGDSRRANDELDRALAPDPALLTESTAVTRGIIAWRLQPQRKLTRPANMTPLSDALWRAFESHVAGNQQNAIAALAEARSLGVESSRLSDEARWLELQLGLTVSPEIKLDPPYPPLSRVMIRRQLSLHQSSL